MDSGERANFAEQLATLPRRVDAATISATTLDHMERAMFSYATRLPVHTTCAPAACGLCAAAATA